MFELPTWGPGRPALHPYPPYANNEEKHIYDTAEIAAYN
jgi:hypothetical protein